MNRRIPILVLLSALPLAVIAAEPVQQAPAPPPPDMGAPAVKAAPADKDAPPADRNSVRANEPVLA